jgi:hypothetical protein
MARKVCDAAVLQAVNHLPYARKVEQLYVQVIASRAYYLFLLFFDPRKPWGLM